MAGEIKKVPAKKIVLKDHEGNYLVPLTEGDFIADNSTLMKNEDGTYSAILKDLFDEVVKDRELSFEEKIGLEKYGEYVDYGY